jgi:acyl dehydratase
MATDQLHATVSELVDTSASFIECFAQAVAERLPSHTRETVARAVERFFDRNMDSPIIQLIHADATAARLSLISGVFEGDAHAFVVAAVERSAARISGLFERDNVLAFQCPER